MIPGHDAAIAPRRMGNRTESRLTLDFRVDDVAASNAAVAKVIGDLAARGFAIVTDFLPAQAIAALRAEALRRDAAGELVAAGIGRATERAVRSDIRGDRIRWLDDEHSAPAEQALHDALTTLRDAINRHLLLGAWRFEGHYALYPTGAAYARHRDAFRGQRARAGGRVVSCILYLNEDWQATDGGALRIHFDNGATCDVLPAGGTLVAFLAADFEHEVLPATRPRLAVTGWFRTRES